jgi:hypothetical protein
VRGVLALQLVLLLGLAALLLDAVAVDHAVDAHALLAVRALACSEAHIIISVRRSLIRMTQ